jgi:hypothetical protein
VKISETFFDQLKERDENLKENSKHTPNFQKLLMNSKTFKWLESF